MVIAILNPKGGCGKSTLATNMAHVLQVDGHDVLLVDTDTHGTIGDWHAGKPPESTLPPVIRLEPKRLYVDLNRLATPHKVVVIDGTAKMMQGLGLSVKVADLILIPVQPTAADLWAVGGLAELILTRQRIQENLPVAAFVLTRDIPRARLAAEAKNILEGYGLPVLESRVTQRVAYVEAMNHSSTVLEMAPKSKAAKEMRQLCKEMKALYDHRYRETHGASSMLAAWGPEANATPPSGRYTSPQHYCAPVVAGT